MTPRQPLLLADDLCEYSRSLIQNNPQQEGVVDGAENREPQIDGTNLSSAQGGSTNPQGGSGSHGDQKANSKNKERSRKAALKAQ